MAILKPISINTKVVCINIGKLLEKRSKLLDDFSKEKVSLCDFYEPLPCEYEELFLFIIIESLEVLLE